MDSDLRAKIAFRLAGLKPGGAAPPEWPQLRPALAARVHDVSRLRHDFPVVLATTGEALALPLTAVVDGLIARLAPGDPDPACLRASLLRLESDIRQAIAHGASGTLRALWERDAGGVVHGHVEAALARARKALDVDGPVVGCDALFARRLVRHAWRRQQERRAQRLQDEVARLRAGLVSLLSADEARSPAGCTTARLRDSFGAAFRDAFDFHAMSRLLGHLPEGGLDDARRTRLRTLLAALEGNRELLDPDPRAYEFERCGPALTAFRARYPGLRKFALAMAMARLEVDNAYDEARHGPVFAELGDKPVAAGVLARFPDYLVCVRDAALSAAERGDLLETLASGMPVKLLVQSDDLVGEADASEGLAAFGARMHALAGAAIAGNEVLVVQAASSVLPRMAPEIADALGRPGPAFIGVYSGAAAGPLPCYLNAAAAVESRVFPAFVYDPARPAASRWSLGANPQEARDWPVHAFEYEDADHQRVRREMAFTAADFAAADPRLARHFQALPAGDVQSVGVAEWLEKAPAEGAPTVALVDANDALHALVADEAMLAQARRCLERWRMLRALAAPPPAPPQALMANAPREAVEAAAPPPAAPQPAAPAPAGEAAAPAQDARSADEPYIETARCTTCNECTQINSRMFAYDANKQAYIADPAAGTYRQLVEAAESCQVSIIHPGKPRDPAEPGLDELLVRAEPFL